MNNVILSVSQLNNYIKSVITSDYRLQGIFVKGEISNFTNHIRSGHYYFSLKDDKSVIKAVMFKNSNLRLKFMPENGMKVVALCRVDVYERDGVYQLYIEDLLPDGIGGLTKAYEQLKEKLSKEGLFDSNKKKELPFCPKRVGVITSPTGAVKHDIEKVIERRFPLTEIVFCPVQVQGDLAVGQIVNAIERFNKVNAADVLIVGRGGGSIEDLWAFNCEEVVRAIYKSNIPVISAVGHETDTTLADLVADFRASTPSVAAEVAVPDSFTLRLELNATKSKLKKQLQDKLYLLEQNLNRLNSSKVLKSPESFLEYKSLALDSLNSKLNHNFKNINDKKTTEFSVLTGKLVTLNPLSTLSRGYALVKKQNKWVKSVKTIKKDDNIIVKLCDGEVNCVVSNVVEGKNEKENNI